MDTLVAGALPAGKVGWLDATAAPAAAPAERSLKRGSGLCIEISATPDGVSADQNPAHQRSGSLREVCAYFSPSRTPISADAGQR
ncbi:MAG TPA: hypothetical protein PLB26_12140, partial [Rubrivivax sp.]|nr:hypothetical protein [Rubrivivax sp.]